MRSGWRGASLALVVAASVATAGIGPVVAQDAGAGDASADGTGSNLAFTIVEAKPPFFQSGPETVAAGSPGAYVRRASVAGEGDERLLVVSLSDADVIRTQARTIREIDRIAGTGGTITWWGDVLKQTLPLTAEMAPNIGFVIAVYGGKDATLRQEMVAASADRLVSIEDVFLVAKTRGGVDLVALYELVGSDLAAGVSTADTIQDALGANEMEIEVEGIAVPLSDLGA